MFQIRPRAPAWIAPYPNVIGSCSAHGEAEPAQSPESERPVEAATASIGDRPESTGEGVGRATTSAGVAASTLSYLHACPVCTSKSARHYCRVPSLFNDGQYICYERCLDCGTVRRNPRLPDDLRLGRYENDELRPQQRMLIPRNQVHYRYMMKLIRSHSTAESPRLLDFGCGAGGFLIEARDAGFDVYGLELSRGLAELVRDELDIPVHQGLITDERFRNQCFDVIVSSQVFEHLVDPVQTLQSVKQHLRQGGLLLIEVPNLLSTQERVKRGSTMDDSHLFYFTCSSLSGMLKREGFEIVATQQGIRPWRYASAQRLPWKSLFLGERVLSLLGLRSGLSVLARATH